MSKDTRSHKEKPDKKKSNSSGIDPKTNRQNVKSEGSEETDWPQKKSLEGVDKVQHQGARR